MAQHCKKQDEGCDDEGCICCCQRCMDAETEEVEEEESESEVE